MRARVFSALMTFGLVLALVASPALAQGNYGGYLYDGVNIRTGPATSYTSIGLGYEGHVVCLFYLVQGEPIEGMAWWANHTNLTTGVGPGYSNFYYMFYNEHIC